jgi:excisionase family DNA binding protein
MPEAFLTAAEVATWLRVNVETVYDLIAQQGLPAIRLGGRWRFQECEVRAWLERSASRGRSDT